MEEGMKARNVYLPPGTWIDYQTGKSYAGGWHNIEAGKFPIVMLVRDGTALPHIKLAQSTSQMDWSNLELVVFAKNAQQATGSVCLPENNELRPVSVVKRGEGFALAQDPLPGKVTWRIRSAEIR
jgi:alpha-D-xyloside xylohydrolase